MKKAVEAVVAKRTGQPVTTATDKEASMATTTTVARKAKPVKEAAKGKARAKTARPRPVATTTAPPKQKDGRWQLPPAGTVITRPYKGKVLKAKVHADGVLECNGKRYDSLGALTRGVTVGQTDGFQFWFRKEWLARRPKA